MCGIAGILSTDDAQTIADPLERMIRVQAHRGPDSLGTWFERVGRMRVGLATARLAILDLSDAANQPFVSLCGQHVLVFNGEIFNFIELRAELRAVGWQFRTGGDTEVLLYALLQWGEQALLRLNGMWGLAWLDRHAGQLLLARDRLGIKPLYFHCGFRSMFFASEIKGILTAADRRFGVNATVVARYLMQSLRDAQAETFFDGIQALPAGHIARVNLRAPGPPRPQVQRYWRADAQSQAFPREQDAIEAVRDVFFDAVRIRLRSDVPVGVLLSGGLDSAGIAAAAHHFGHRSAELHCISAVSDDPLIDEQPFIDRVAAHLGLRTQKVLIRHSPAELLELFHTATYYNDEPLGGFGNVVHYLLMREAQALGTTVLLTGQGGDELLCGYLKYLGFYLQNLVAAGRPLAAAQVFVDFARQRTVLHQLRWQDAKRYLPRLLRGPRMDVCGPRLQNQLAPVDIGLGSNGVIGRQAEDLYRFSVPPILHTEDRLSMAASREIRVPFLDYRLVDLLLPLPPELKLRKGWTKWLMRRVLEPYLPPEIVWRKDKRHFATSEESWLRNDLRAPIDALLNGELLVVQSGFVDREHLRAAYATFCRPRRTGWIGFQDIFNPLGLEVWMRQFAMYLDEPAGSAATIGEAVAIQSRAPAR